MAIQTVSLLFNFVGKTKNKKWKVEKLWNTWHNIWAEKQEKKKKSEAIFTTTNNKEYTIKQWDKLFETFLCNFGEFGCACVNMFFWLVSLDRCGEKWEVEEGMVIYSKEQAPGGDWRFQWKFAFI